MTRMQLYVHWQPSLMAGKKCSLMERKYSVNAYDTTAQFGTMQNTIEIESLFLRQNTRLKDREIGVIKYVPGRVVQSECIIHERGGEAGDWGEGECEPRHITQKCVTSERENLTSQP